MSGPRRRATSSSSTTSPVGAVALGVAGVALCVLAGAVIAHGLRPRAGVVAPGAPPVTSCCQPGAAARAERVRPVLPGSPPAMSDESATSERASVDAEAPEPGDPAGSTGELYVHPPPPPEAFLPAPPRPFPDPDTGLVFRSEPMGGSLLEAKLLEAKLQAMSATPTPPTDSLPPAGSADIHPPPSPEAWLPSPPRATPDRDTGLVFSNQPALPASGAKR